MKLSWGLAFSSLYCAASAAQEAHVYIYDATAATTTQAPSSVNPVTARLILARRLGLSKFHSLEHLNKDSIQQLNAFGGKQPKLFGGEGRKDHELLWINDVEDFEAYAYCYKDWTSFTIRDPPTASDNTQLLDDMTKQARSLSRNKMFTETHSGVTVPNEWLTISRQDAKGMGNACPAKQPTSSITVVLMPLSSKDAKRSPRPYGIYDSPSTLQPRREPKEAPLSLTSKPTTSPSPNVSDLEDFPVITQAEGNNTKAPLGILKRCYASKDACLTETNSCSGHGTCKSPHRENDKSIPVCYACQCVPEVKHRDGKGMETSSKTIYWGGPACQKKDVSVPFWLLTGTTVLLVFLIASGIGLLYSMGSEELPSVIGAGVSGPARK
ncbi:hypothetical protein CC80DRAFT_490331 [Byssothecium circinans]|uniref:Uncharacterized protein n=1 Tax=Byssothecium circinans TaxID=147558 RepID=A0A6A5U2P7_9PLEO|nr:hypothetical protein CC80DRAFT_490331 [Byssothecium circinans]